MSCSTCSAKFGFLKKELGCPGCGFSCCSKCLKFEIDGVTSHVCKNCHDKSQKKGQFRPPPDAFLKRLARLETLEDPSRPPVTIYAHQTPPALQNLTQATKNDDVPSEIELRGRLQKLRKRLTAAPSVEEIEVRLARLQGMHHNPKHHSFDVSSMTKKSDEEQTRDLVKQMEEEAALRKSYESAWQADVEARLAKLKGEAAAAAEGQAGPSEEAPKDPESLLKQICSEAGKGGTDKMEVDDEESEIDIINKVVAEIALDEKYLIEDLDASDDELVSDSVTEELPWCTICNEDATLRCPGCAGDLFCKECFKKCHDVCDMREHQPVKYKPPSVEDLI
ncbi:abscission/NoCut checkpoint regulator [Cloeon dipterum]|uniref:abscission/NoCut checkpoint regulator n=1 Tax=Cloeon dipterum TaxID=197152 RepID=UPI00322057E2